MSNEYLKVKKGSLKLKGNKTLFKADKMKKKHKEGEGSRKQDVDAIEHGGWRRIDDEVHLEGGFNISFEASDNPRCYLAAMDNGKFTLGGPHPEGEGPAPEEIFALIKTPDENKISLKTGYGKYIGVSASGELVATAEAIGTRERFIPVFQDGKSAIQAVCNSLFLSLRPDREGYIFVGSRTVSPDEVINIRTDAIKKGPVDWRSEEDKKKAKECETAYVKMFQHSKVQLKGRHIAVDVNDKSGVKKAQQEGNLHEELLNRRQKTKSDRYC